MVTNPQKNAAYPRIVMGETQKLPMADQLLTDPCIPSRVTQGQSLKSIT